MRRSFALLLGTALTGALAAPLLDAPLLARPAEAAAVAAAATAPGAELGYDRLTIRRGDTWYLQPDLDGGAFTSYREETGGWMPVAGDTDGNGSESLSLFKDGVWRIRETPGGTPKVVRFGLRGDVPLLGDWNGDGVDSVGLFRRGQWFVRDNSTSGPTRTFNYGLGYDQPVVGDWDGNGRTDIAVVRNRTWYQRDSVSGGNGQRSFAFGNIGDRRFAGDWDHDGRDSPGVFRDGTWYLRQSSNPTAPYTTAYFGRAGDTPLVRRTAGLAPGVTHRVVRDGAGPFTAHVATIDLAQASSPDTVLSNGRLAGLESTTSMSRRAGAVLGVNGDYFQSNGRPVHAFAADGRLLQTPQLAGRAVSIDATGRNVRMGIPDSRASFTAYTATGTSTIAMPRWNSGRADSDSLAAFSAAGAELETPPSGDCYAGLAYLGSPTVHPDGGVDTAVRVTGKRCGGDAPIVPSTGLVLDGSRYNPSGSFLDDLWRDQQGQLTTHLGFPGAVDVLGGNPILISGGRIQWADVTGTDAFSGRQPRTAVGVTGDGKMLLVVVDGRQPGYSVGMSLYELADLMSRLGAQNAFNLDGGGSSAMFVNGQRVNRPSDGYERGVGSALVVLPGADPGQADLTVAAPATAGATTAPRVMRAPEQPLVSPVVGGTPLAGWVDAARDPGSIGGLADALEQDGVPLPPELQRADTVYDSSR